MGQRLHARTGDGEQRCRRAWTFCRGSSGNAAGECITKAVDNVVEFGAALHLASLVVDGDVADALAQLWRDHKDVFTVKTEAN